MEQEERYSENTEVVVVENDDRSTTSETVYPNGAVKEITESVSEDGSTFAETIHADPFGVVTSTVETAKPDGTSQPFIFGSVIKICK